MFKKVFILTASLLGLTLVLSGCGEPEPTVKPQPTSTIAQPQQLTPLNPATGSEIEKYCPLVDAVSLEESGISALTKEMKTAYFCEQVYDETSQMTYNVAYQAESGLNTTLLAYSEPSEKIVQDQMCTLQLSDPLIIWVVSAGDKPIPVYAPVDTCGAPTVAAAEARQKMFFTEILRIPAENMKD